MVDNTTDGPLESEDYSGSGAGDYYYYDDYADFSHVDLLYDVDRYMWLVVSPVLLFAGTVGNILCVVVIQISELRRTSSSFSLCALALVDCAVLYTGLLRQWVFYLTEQKTDLRLFNDVCCKVHNFATFYFQQLSSWTVVLLTVERTLSVRFPLATRLKYNRRHVITTWGVLASFLFLVNSHFFWTHTIETVVDFYPEDNFTDRYKDCYFGGDYTGTFESAWKWIDWAVVSLVPCVIILCGNTIIIVTLTRRQKTQQSLMQTRTSHRAGTSSSSSRRQTQQPGSPASITPLLIALSTVFLFTTLPVTIYFIEADRWFPEDGTHKTLAHMYITYAVCNLVYYTNNALNFLLYVISGRQFRQAFLALLKGGCRRTARASDTGRTPRRSQTVTSFSQVSRSSSVTLPGRLSRPNSPLQ